jgi:ArsR family transcriptional regulator
MTTAETCVPIAVPADRAMGEDTSTRLATTLKALADPLRLRALSLLAASPTGEACVCDIAALADVSQPTVSHHLKVLRDVGLLTADRRGTWVYYAIAPAYRAAVTTLLEAFAPDAIEPDTAVHTTAASDSAAPDTAARPAAAAQDGLRDVDPVLERIAGELTPRFPDVDPGQVLSVVRESYTALARGAGIRTHLVVSAERFARQRLEDLTRPTTGDRRPQVLFVCVANAGRSQLAAALLHHYAGDAVVARSAGSTPGRDIHASVRAELADLGIDTRSGEVFPKPLTDDAVRAADVVITMGCGDTCPILPGKRYEDWAVGDPALASPEGVAAIRADVDQRVRALLGDLVPDLHLPTT